MPDLPITLQLSSLPRLHKVALEALWCKLFETEAPARMRKELMVQFLAYRIQEQKFGPLSDTGRRCLGQLAKIIKSSSGTFSSPVLPIKPGTRLIRQWKDQVHTVNVSEGSYEYRGDRYRSLSEIARLITGTRWSGPLFFGLKGNEMRNSKEAV